MGYHRISLVALLSGCLSYDPSPHHAKSRPISNVFKALTVLSYGDRSVCHLQYTVDGHTPRSAGRFTQYIVHTVTALARPWPTGQVFRSRAWRLGARVLLASCTYCVGVRVWRRKAEKRSGGRPRIHEGPLVMLYRNVRIPRHDWLA